MKLNLKSFIAGFLAASLISAGTVAFAESSETIQAIFGRVKLVVADKPVEQETMLHNGTTYVPLRAAAEILGKEVAWDGATNTAYIDEKGKGRTFEQTSITPPTVEPINTIKIVDLGKLNTASDIQKSLNDNFSEVDTILGTLTFRYEVEENSKISKGYDYWIKTSYNDEYFHDVKLSIKYTNEQKQIYGTQLKNHQERVAKSLIEALPDKKLFGSYYYGYWKYPNLKVDWQEIYAFPWCNFTIDGFYEDDTPYHKAQISEFIWLERKAMFMPTTEDPGPFK